MWPTVGGFSVGIFYKSVKVDMVDNEHVKIYYFQVGGSGHSFQCLMSEQHRVLLN